MSPRHSSESSSTTRSATSTDRRRRTRALLAGGVVLGVGATMTLAAWTDDEFATGLFNTTTFGIEGATDGTTFSSHATSPNAAALTVSNGLTMSPDSTVYTRYAIRSDANNNAAGTLKLTGVTSAGNTALAALYDFKMGTVASNSATCDSTTSWNWVSTSAVPNAAPSNGTTPALAANSQTPVYICIAVHLTSNQASITSAKGANASITWQWTGTSNS